MTTALTGDRFALVRRGLLLNYLTIGYNVVEAVVSVGAGVVAGSVALVSFGADSGIEVTSSLAAQFVGHRAGRGGPECGPGLVVGRSGRRARDGTDHH